MNKPNIILIVLDTLREDYSKYVDSSLKKYGFVRLKNVITPSPWTLPAHASMFTGLYPLRHGAHATKEVKIHNIKLKGHRLLTQDLREFGFKNYLFTANEFIRPYFGFRNFDKIKIVPAIPIIVDKDIDREKMSKYRGKNQIETALNAIKAKEYLLLIKYAIREISIRARPLSRIYCSLLHQWPMNKGITKLIRYLKRENFKRPFFLFVNLMEVHEPYTVFDKGAWVTNIKSIPDKKRIKIINTWKRRYPIHANYLGKKMECVMRALEDKKVSDDDLIIVVGDHGQLLGEDGKIGHGVLLWDELLRVPMWIRGNINMESIEGYLSLVKIRKMIIDYALNGKINMKNYYKKHVYAESYGIYFPYKITENNKEYIEYVDSYRVAVYCCEGKAIFNVKRWVVEEIKGLKMNEAKNLILNFLKI